MDGVPRAGGAADLLPPILYTIIMHRFSLAFPVPCPFFYPRTLGIDGRERHGRRREAARASGDDPRADQYLLLGGSDPRAGDRDRDRRGTAVLRKMDHPAR